MLTRLVFVLTLTKNMNGLNVIMLIVSRTLEGLLIFTFIMLRNVNRFLKMEAGMHALTI
jgi:hypothetical protein